MGVHPPHAAFDNPPATYVHYRYDDSTLSTTQLHFDPSTILGIQYDDSTNIIPRYSADAFDNSHCADALNQIRRYPLTIPRIPFDDSADDLWITHAANLQIL